MNSLMQKVFRRTILIGWTVLLCSSGSITFGESGEKEKPDFINKADSIIVSTSGKETVNALLKEGWEIVSNPQNVNQISTMSLPGCGKVENQPVLKHYDYTTNRWVYLIHATWNFICSEWDDGSGNAWDILAMAVVDQNNLAVNAQAEYTQIYVYDEEGDSYPARGAVSTFNAAGVGYTIADEDGVFDNPGIKGEAWFYIQKPTSGTSYYVRSQWTHTWNRKPVTLTGINIGYQPPMGFSVGITWKNNPPQSWTASDQDYITFP